MPKRNSKASQAKSEKRALKKLRAAGLYTGKLDLRKKTNSYQKRLIAKFKDVVTGKAAVVKPKDAASYKSLFRVKGDKVIVPRRKGEKIKVSKRGTIITERKVGNRTVKSTFRKVKHRSEISGDMQTMYFVPFIRGKDAHGKPIVEWKRFPNKDILKSFMEGYDYKDWTNYVVEEKVSREHPYAKTPGLEAKLERKLKRGKRLKFSDTDDDDGDE